MRKQIIPSRNKNPFTRFYYRTAQNHVMFMCSGNNVPRTVEFHTDCIFHFYSTSNSLFTCPIRLHSSAKLVGIDKTSGHYGKLIIETVGIEKQLISSGISEWPGLKHLDHIHPRKIHFEMPSRPNDWLLNLSVLRTGTAVHSFSRCFSF